MRRVLAVVFFAGTPFCWQPLWGQAPGVRVEYSHKPKHQPELPTAQAQPDKRGTQESPLVVETHDRRQTDKEATEAQANKDSAEFINRWTFRFTGIAALATVLLVIVGWFGVKAANRTLRAIERQVTLQAASMTQWVSVSKWIVNVAQTVGPLSPQPKVLSIEFAVVNESDFPLIMRATFRFFGLLPNRAELHTVGDVDLFPEKPHYMRVPSLRLTEDQGEDYVGNGLRIAVHGQIIHVGVAKEQSPLMTIRGNLFCGKGISAAYLENESIRLIPIEPGPEKSLLGRLRLRWKRAPQEPSQDENPN
jgi:hypothetical protein